MSTISQELRIIRSTETIPVEHPIFLIFGQPGLGKSSLGFSAKNPILLNFDSESALARTVNRREAIDILTIEALRALRQQRTILEPFDTVVIDTVGCCVNLMAADIMDETPKYGKADGNPTQQGYGALKNAFRLWMTQLRAMGKDIVLVAHHKEDKNGDTVFVRPDITGGSKDEVLRVSDFVGFLYMNGKHRTMDFNPTEQWFGKNPAQWPAWKVPAAEKAQTFLAELFDRGRAALGKISEASAKLAQQVDTWRVQIDTFQTAHEFNRALPQLQQLPESLVPQVRRMVLDRANALHLELKNGTFSDPKLEPQPTGSFL